MINLYKQSKYHNDQYNINNHNDQYNINKKKQLFFEVVRFTKSLSKWYENLYLFIHSLKLYFEGIIEYSRLYY
jgi:hypothetical protein